jgi:hypothetical protein
MFDLPTIQTENSIKLDTKTIAVAGALVLCFAVLFVVIKRTLA